MSENSEIEPSKRLFDSATVSSNEDDVNADLNEPSGEDEELQIYQSKVEELKLLHEESKRATEEAQRENARALISRVVNAPEQRNRKILMCKAFLKWSKMVPLHQKCDELAGQLQDRLVAIAAIRDSYLRDVVRVKHHLSKVQEFKFPDSDEPAFAKLSGHDMYDLHVVPSMSLQKLVDRAKDAASGASSTQLQETLIQAGLINVSTGKAYNAWEKGKMFKKIMKFNRGRDYKLPQTNGESISLATPQTHELFVKYCKSCIGIMQFVRTWNHEVEDSLRYKAEGQIMEAEIESLKKAINSINSIVRDQEQAIVDRDSEIVLLKKSSTFMDQWAHSLSNKEREVELEDKIKKMRNERDMAAADIESTAHEVAARRREEMQKWELREARYKFDFEQAVIEKNEETRLRMEMLDHLTSSQIKVGEHEAAIGKYIIETTNQRNRITEIISKFEVAERDSKILQSSLDKKTAEYDTYKIQSELKISDLTTEVDTLSKDVENRDAMLEQQYGELADMRKSLDTATDELTILRQDKAQREKIEREEAERIARKPKHSLRVIALVVLCNNRFVKAIKGLSQNPPEFHLLGALGRRTERNRYETIITETSNTLTASQAECVGLKKNVKELKNSNEKLKALIKEMREKMNQEKAVQKQLEEELGIDKKTIAKLREELRNLEERDKQRLIKLKEVMKLAKRTQFLVHLQRDHINKYCHAMMTIGGIAEVSHPDRVLKKDFLKVLNRKTKLLKMAQEDSNSIGETADNACGDEEDMKKPKVSTVRMEEVKTTFWKATASLLGHFKKFRAVRPCDPFAVTPPGEEVFPLDAPSDNFHAKMKESTALHMTMFREDAAKIDAHCRSVLAGVRKVDQALGNERMEYVKNMLTIEEKSQEITRLEGIIADWEQKEKKRLKEAAKKEKRLAKKRKAFLQRADMLTNSKLINPAVRGGRKPAHPPPAGGGGAGLGASAKRPSFDLGESGSVEKDDAGNGINNGSPNSESDGSSDDESSSSEVSADPNEEIMKQMMEQITDLSGHVDDLEKKLTISEQAISDWVERGQAYEEEQIKNHSQVKQATSDYEAAIGRIRSLRYAVEDGYRERRKEVLAVHDSYKLQEEMLQKEIKAKRRNRGTNIACSVCAIRATETAHEHDDAGMHVSVFADEPMVNEILDQALEGDVVLTAKPRSINRKKAIDSTQHKDDVDDSGASTKQIDKFLHDPHPHWNSADRDLEKPEISRTSNLDSDQKDSKFRTMRSIPRNTKNMSDTKGRHKTAVPHTEPMARTHSAEYAKTRNSDSNRGVRLTATASAGRIDTQTAAYVQYDTTMKYGLGTRRPATADTAGEPVAITHRPLQAMPMRSRGATQKASNPNLHDGDRHEHMAERNTKNYDNDKSNKVFFRKSSMSLKQRQQQQQQQQEEQPYVDERDMWELTKGSFDLGVLRDREEPGAERPA